MLAFKKNNDAPVSYAKVVLWYSLCTDCSVSYQRDDEREYASHLLFHARAIKIALPRHFPGTETESEFVMRETSGISARSSRNSTPNPARSVRRHSSELSEFRRTNPPVNRAPEVTYRAHAVARGAFCVRAELADSHSRLASPGKSMEL
jgi:hypothetical protein